MAGTGSLYHKTQPTSTNYLYPNYFNFRLMKLPSTNFTLQSANVPGVSLGRLDQPNPAHGAPLQGDRMFFGDFACSFLILEDMSNYIRLQTTINSFRMQVFVISRQGQVKGCILMQRCL